MNIDQGEIITATIGKNLLLVYLVTNIKIKKKASMLIFINLYLFIFFVEDNCPDEMDFL